MSHAPNRWYPASQRLLRSVAHALRVGFVTTGDLGRWFPDVPERRRQNMAYNWVRRGYFVCGDRRGRYVPTAKAIGALDSAEGASMNGGMPDWHGLRLMHEHLRVHGVADLSTISHVTGMTTDQARNRAYLWARQGLLRRTHHNTYRLPKVDEVHTNHTDAYADSRVSKQNKIPANYAAMFASKSRAIGAGVAGTGRPGVASAANRKAGGASAARRSA